MIVRREMLSLGRAAKAVLEELVQQTYLAMLKCPTATITSTSAVHQCSLSDTDC